MQRRYLHDSLLFQVHFRRLSRAGLLGAVTNPEGREVHLNALPTLPRPGRTETQGFPVWVKADLRGWLSSWECTEGTYMSLAEHEVS